MLSFSVIIVSWNALDHLQTFLPSVVATGYEDFEILLADNASTDGSAEWVGKTYPEVKVVSLDRNYGYCGGNNRAAVHAKGDILLFLNNDVRVEEDWLDRLNECFGARPDWSAVQPKILSQENPRYFEYAGAAGGYLDRYGYPFCRGRIFDTVEEDRRQYDSREDILWASGAALAIRKEAFFQAGGFDEDFEFHMEEIDLCWRLWNSGRKVGFCPDSRVYHLGGGSMAMGSPRKIYYNYRNNLIMLVKNYSTWSLWTKLPIRFLLDWISALRMLLKGGFRNVAAFIKAYLHAVGMLPETLSKRNKLKQKKSISGEPEAILPVSIVWHYFIRRISSFKDL